MGQTQFIWIKNRRYYYYDSYDTWEQARKQAKYHFKRNKCKYFILAVEEGFYWPEKKYRLYLDKCIRLI